MGVFCVNTTSLEFKSTAKRLNIHPDSLEVYVHLFQNSTAASKLLAATGELPFPSDEQIREYFSLGNRLSGIQAIDAWVEKYGATDGFVSNSMLEEAIDDYGRDSVHSYADYSGKVIHKVSRPEITSLKELKYLLQKLNIIDSKGDLLGISIDRFYERINNLAIPMKLASQIEMDIIKREAVADGTFMKAPNGNPTNLNERQWLQVRTKAFKKWFGDWEKLAPTTINTDTVGSSPVALSYLLEGGLNTIESTGYLLHGISAAFELTAKEIENIRSKYLNKIDPNPATFINDKTGALQEIKNTIEETYGQQGLNILNDILHNATGFYAKEGNKIQNRLDELNSTIKRAQIRNISKVVDENGEPLIVYRMDESKFNTFNRTYIGTKRPSFFGKGFYFTSSFDYASSFPGNVLRDFFLKATDVYSTTNPDDFSTLETSKSSVNWLNELDKDDELVVFDSNQIKSASDNTGAFSRYYNSVYANREALEVLDILTDISKTLKYLIWNELESKYNTHEIISKAYDRFFITQSNVNKAIQLLEEQRLSRSLPEGIFTLIQRKKSIEVILNKEVLKDVIERNQRNANNFLNLFESLEEAQAVKDVLDFLSAKTRMQYETISFKEAKKLSKTVNDKTNAFVHDGVCYFIEGRKLNVDIASEEMLHPFINALRKLNPVLFNNLLIEAQQAFPKLKLEIEESYKKESLDVREEELVTQSLARAFRVELENHPQRREIKSLLDKFISWIRDILRIGTKKYVLTDEISVNTKLTDLAKILNTELELFYNSSYAQLTRANQEESQQSLQEDSGLTTAMQEEDAKWETIFQEHEDKIEFIEGSHEYYFYPKGKSYPENRVKMDTSVTSITNPVERKPRNEEDGLDWLDVSSNIGTSADRVVRDYFMGVDITARKYPNFTTEQLKILAKNLVNFKAHLDKVIGGGTRYKVITRPFNLVGKITKYNNNTLTLGGAVDILIYDENGNYYIYDIKTSRNELRGSKNLEKYTSLLNLYREMLEAMHPELRGCCAKLGILQLNTFYATPKNLVYRQLTGSTIYTVDNKGLLQANGVSIENHKEYKAPRFVDNDTLKAVIDDIEQKVPEQYYIDGRHKSLVISALDNWSSNIDTKSDLTSIKNQPIVSITESTGGYEQRTKENADWSDITLALATDFNTAGEKLTKRVAGDKYVSSIINPKISLENLAEGIAANVFDQLDSKNTTKNLKLNIAGNGIYTLTNNYTQEQINDLVYKILRNLLFNGITISEVRSGGQTGVDEAGIIAAQRLGIPASIHAPKGYTFRNSEGKDISDEQAFKARFNEIRTQSTINNVERHKGDWSRQEAINNPRILYVFTDNTDRDSGSGIIPDDSWYSKKYGKGHHFPTVTAAVVRGLDNTRPISTQRWYHQGAKGATGRWTDTNVAEFKKVIREELEEIVKEFNTGKYDKIMFPDGGGLFNTKISNITKERTPLLYQALADLLHEYGFDSLIPSDIIISEQSETQEEYDARKNDELDALLSTMPEITTISEASPSGELYSDYEKELIRQREALNALKDDKDSLFKPSELSGLAKACMFLVSDFISDISSSRNNNEKYFKYLTDKNKAEELIKVDFTQMSRIDILNKLGMNAYYVIRDYYFNGLNNPNGNSFRRDTRKKLQYIHLNFEAFLEMGEATIAKLENVLINVDNAKIYIVDESSNQILNDETADVVAEIAGSSVEHWQVSFRQVSAHASLSLLIKRTIGTLFDFDLDGNKKLNQFGIPERINESLAINQILQWTQGAENLSLMVDILKDKQKSNPWVKQLVDKLDDNSQDETFKSQFWSNFKKYFQPYIIQYQKEIKDAEGNVVGSVLTNKVINQRGLEKLMLDDFLALYQSVVDGEDGMLLYVIDKNDESKNGLINKETVKILSSSLETLKKYLDENTDSQDIQAGIGVKAAISNIYRCFEIELDDDTLDGLGTYDTVNSIYKRTSHILKKLNSNTKTKYLNLTETNRGDLETLFSHVVDNSSTTLESVSYEDGKLHYSYVTPSYLSNLIDKLKGNIAINEKDKTSKEDAYQRFIEYNYGKYPWFKQGDKWRNEWLKLLADDVDGCRNNLQHAVVLTTKPVGSSVSVGYRDKSPMLYAKSMILNYFYGGKNSNWALYRIPIMSNKPSEEYIRFRRYIEDEYKDNIADLLINVALQEIDRIATVRQRKNNEDTVEIKSFDKNGSKFLFLDYLQPILEEYLEWHNKEENEGKTLYYEEYEDSEIVNMRLLLGQMLELQIQGNENFDDASFFNKVLKTVIKEEMTKKFEDYLDDMRKEGLLEQDSRGKYIHLKDIEMLEGLDTLESLENFFWNDTFAAINILQLTVTDIAYYKNAEDLQKRLAQIHAPGLKGNSQARWNGLAIMDSKTRTIYISDFDEVVSDAIENIKQVFENKAQTLEKVNPKEAVLFREQSKHIIEAFESINVTDAQGYNSITSYRKKAIAFGKWSDELEDMYKKVRNGSYDTRDLEIMMQPLKPFIYSNTAKKSVGPLSTLKVGMQNKNSEYLLLMMDAILQGDTDTLNPTQSKLAAIYQVMEESHYDNEGNYKTDGIDTVLFNSTVKAGEMGVIDINNATTTLEAKLMIEAAIYNDGIKGNGYNFNSVHELEFDDYCILNEVPAHLEGSSIFGSQMRILSISDMPEVVNGVEQFITYRGLLQSIREVKNNYMKAIATNIQESLDAIIRQFNIGGTRQERNVALSRLLLELIKGDSRFGYDLLYSVSTDENGNFNIPISDPINAGRVQLLLHSIIKSRINKLMIEGGPVVQVTNFGTSKELDIVFKDKNGNRLDTLREWYVKQDFNDWFDRHNLNLFDIPSSYEEFAVMHRYKKAKEGTREYELYHNVYVPLRKLVSEKYKAEVASKQAGIMYIECYAPSTVFKQFADENGFIDFDKIPEEMKTIIGFRIPTEFKYSMAPLKIVGLLPSEAGEGIMLPKDITTLSGSDFDVDKLYIIRPVVRFNNALFKKYFEENSAMLFDNKGIWDWIYEHHSEINDEIKREQDLYYQEQKSLYGFKGTKKEAIELAGKKAKKDWLEFPENWFDMAIQELDTLGELHKYEKGKHVKVDGKLLSYKALRKQARADARYYEKITDEGTKGGRDNVIFDTIWAMLTSEQAMDLIFTPGNFDEPKKYGYMAEAIRLHPEMSYEEINAIYAKDGVDALKDLIAKSKNLVYNNVHLAFHKQNMVAGKLIGIFALNNVSHSIISLIDQSPMTDDSGNIIKDVTGKPKLWRPTILIEEPLIEIEGNTIGGGEVSFDALEDKQGKRISNTLAAFLAASVDAVKDPVLNFMNINETTAGILTSLIRMGYDTELAMLFLTQPIIREVISKYAIQNEEGYKGLGELIDETIKSINVNNIDLSLLALPSIDKESLISTLRKASPEENINILRALKALDSVSRVTSAIVSITKFNSVTAAAGPMLSNTILMKQRIYQNLEMYELHTPSMVHALGNPIIKTFRDVEFAAVDKLFSGMMLLATDLFDTIIKKIQDTIAGRMDDALVNKLSDFYLAFLLASTDNPIFKTDSNKNPISELRRTYLYRKLPFEIKKLKKNSNNRFLQILRVMPADEAHEYYWLKVNTRGMSNDVHDTIGLYWQELYQENPDIAMALIEYNFLTSGLGFTPNSFANLIPVALKRIIPNYLLLLNPSRGLLNNEELKRLIDLFVRNNHFDSKIVKTILKTERRNSVSFKDGYVLIDSEEPTITKSFNETDSLYYDYITFKFKEGKDALYKFVGVKGNKVKYIEVSKLGGKYGEILEINPSGEVSPIDLKPKKKKDVKEEEKKPTKELLETASKRIDEIEIDYGDESSSRKYTKTPVFDKMIAQVQWFILNKVPKSQQSERIQTLYRALKAKDKDIKAPEKALKNLFTTYNNGEYNKEAFAQMTNIGNVVGRAIRDLKEVDEIKLNNIVKGILDTKYDLNLCD